jgi:Glyoxalase-like domain
MTPWQAYDIVLDHIVIAAVSLESGEHWLAQRLGVTLQNGGQHAGWGTHNKLLQLGAGVYLELIAIDPNQAEPSVVGADGKTRKLDRPFGLDQPATRRALAHQPRLLHYVMRTRQLAAAAGAIDYDCGVVNEMRRGSLSWQITLGEGGMPCLFGERGTSAGRELVSVLPTLIDWGNTPHPGTTLEQRGVTFQSLTIAANALKLIRLGGVSRDPRMVLQQAGHSALGVELQTPQGWVLLA